METINSQIKENILFRIIENAIKGDEEKLFAYANKFRKEFIKEPMFDEETFRKLIHNYLHPEDGNWATMDGKDNSFRYLDYLNEMDRNRRMDVYVKKRERINGFKDLEDGWDGRGAPTIKTNAIKNAHSLIDLYEEFNLDIGKWSFNPGVNGDVLIDYKGDNVSSIFLIDDCTFTYYLEYPDDDTNILGAYDIPFEVYNVFSLMRFAEVTKKGKP